jgi:hypothetical protein
LRSFSKTGCSLSSKSRAHRPFRRNAERMRRNWQ